MDFFAAFWAGYPRKIGKPQAGKAFDRALRRAPADVILAGLARWAPHWRRGEVRFIPHPTTWLNRDGWNDELPDSGGKPRGRAPAPPPMDRDGHEGRVFL